MKERTLIRLLRLFFSVCALLALPACQTAPPAGKTAAAPLQRRADTPLVLAIPGLNAFAGFDQTIQFGRLVEVLARENIPCTVILYDSNKDPIGNVADLWSPDKSIGFLRVLPRVSTAIAEENRARAAQGLPPLQQLDLVGYSQGSVVLWDLLNRLGECRDWAAQLQQLAPEEWDKLQQDKHFLNLASAVFPFLMVHNVRLQNPKLFETSTDFQNIYFWQKNNFESAAKNFRDYFFSSPDYPRLQERAKARQKPLKDYADIFVNDPFFQYIAFKEMIPLEIRVFSICGSLLGSPEANTGYPLIAADPGLAQVFIGARAKQIRDIRLGSQFQLEWVKDLFRRRVEERKKQQLAAVQFVVGVNGERGDGLVDQPSAHLSRHGLAQISEAQLMAGGEIQWQHLPEFPVTGLPVVHLSRREFLFWNRPGASLIGVKGNPVTDFLFAFETRDAARLKKLHDEEGVPLNQFTVAVYLPEKGKLARKEFSLKVQSKKVKLTGRYENPSSNAVVWTGVFETPDAAAANLRLRVKDKNCRDAEVSLSIQPGKTYFLEITPT